jgi:excisionase family DNA binding protein
MSTRPIEKYYTVQQLAWMLEFDRKTIHTWYQEGRFPKALMIGTDIRIPSSDVTAFLDAHSTVAAFDSTAVAARTPGELVRKTSAGF